MDNPIGALMAQRQRLEQKAAALRQRVEVLTADLTAAVGEQLVSGLSDITNLEQWSEDDYTYGQLHFGGGRFSVRTAIARMTRRTTTTASTGTGGSGRASASWNATRCGAKS
jgi:hypothetical protein